MHLPLFFLMIRLPPIFFVRPSPTLFLFFFNDTATTEIYTLSLHDALPISFAGFEHPAGAFVAEQMGDVRIRTALAAHFHQLAVADPAVGQIDEDLSSPRSEEHTSELQSLTNLVCRLLLEIRRAHV